jgi:hypothetical protein
MFQVLSQTAPLVAQDPRYEVNLGEALITFFQKFDGLNAKRFIRRRTQEELAQIAQQSQASTKSAVQRNEPVPLDDLISTMEKAKELAPAGGNQRISL